MTIERDDLRASADSSTEDRVSDDVRPSRAGSRASRTPRTSGPGASRLAARGAPTPVRRRKRRGAGRNVPVAIAVGLAMGAVVLASLYFVPAIFVGLASVVVVLGIWELGHALSSHDIRLPVPALAAGAVVTIVAAYDGGAEAMLVGVVGTVFAAIAWRARFGERDFLRDASASTLVSVYIPLLVGFAMLLLRSPDGNDRVVVFILAVVGNDVGGFAAGVLFGRHPMAPTISPRKSWEGFVGAVVLSAVVTAFSVHYLLDGAVWIGLVVGVACALAATGGDLTESLLKRDLDLKDMGTLLPGHGGIMDRLDSLLPSAPVAYFLLEHLLHR